MSLLDTFLGGVVRPSRKGREAVLRESMKKSREERAIIKEQKEPEATEPISKMEVVSSEEEDKALAVSADSLEEAETRDNEVSMKTELEALKSEIENLSKQTGEVLTAVGENRDVIAQKVHMENVKAFRNVQAILEELDEKMAKGDIQKKQMESLKLYIRCATWFSLINLFVLVIFILYEMGVF